MPGEGVVRLALEAISDQDPEQIRAAFTEDAVVANDRKSHSGREAVEAWAARAYDHLIRRYALDALEPLGGGLLGRGRVEYLWRESREVGDSSPIWFAVVLSADGTAVQRLALHESESAARADLLGTDA